MLFKSSRRREHNGGLLLYPAAHKETRNTFSLWGSDDEQETWTTWDTLSLWFLMSFVFTFLMTFFYSAALPFFQSFNLFFLFYLPRWHFHLNKSVLLFSITDRHNTTWDLRRVHESSLLVSPNTCSPVEKLRASTLSDRSFGLRRNVWWGHGRRSRGIVDIKGLNVI